MKKFISILVIIIISLAVIRPLFGPNIPFTHDSQNHLGRFANYYLALRQGQIPPRWAPNLNNAFGYPALNFNYPLANLLALPLIIIGLSIETTFKVITVFSIIGSGIFMYFFLTKHFSSKSSLLGALVYLLAPYQFILIYVRGVIGETLSFALLPLLLLFINKYYHQPSPKTLNLLIITFASFLLSHNIIVLFSLPIIFCYILITAGFKRKNLFSFLKPATISLLLVSFFWIPAILEKKYTFIDQTPLINEYKNHFPSLDQLFYSGWGFGFSQPGPVDNLSLSIGIFNIIFVFLSLVILVKSKSLPKIISFSLSVFLLAALLMNSFSQPIYELLPVLQYIQFPWRLLFFTTFASGILTAWVSQKILNLKFWLITITLLFITSLPLANFIQGFHYKDFHWFSFSLTTSTKNENMPIWFETEQNFNFWSQKREEGWDKFVTDLNNKAEFNIISWDGTKHQYVVSSQNPIHLLERTAYFPGWRMTVNGNNQTINFQNQNFPGSITTQLPAGKHEITTKFTQRTTSRIIGNGLTVVGLLLLILTFKHPQLFLT